MNDTLRNILAVVAGIIAGWIANMGIIMLSSSIIPPPQGVDPSNMESIKASMHLFEAKHFIMPFLAHAAGSFLGALVAATIAVSNKMRFAIGMGLFTMIGGVMAAFMIPAPSWFIALDLVVAYIPMALLAGKIASGRG
ncbi:MAG: hypothetical protein EP314_08870 [Bacteroidetes bacterium]|nr:MAG: hypothetical protein EP314_08870 [Bacteroidota bacterium]